MSTAQEKSISPKMTNNMQFHDLPLHKSIQEALTACGYKQPTPVQTKSIPSILEGKDVVVTAQTGTGKTAAFVLPALNRLSQQPPTKKTRILILTPTRELATQVTKAAHLYGKFLRFSIISLVGGMSYHHQIKDLARGADVIVATPGRLLDHIEQRRVDLSHIEILILDEADRMLDMGFIEDVGYIAKLTPVERQTLLFSATLDKQLLTVIKHLLKNPIRIDLSEEKIASPQIKQVMYKTANPQKKTQLLKQLLTEEAVYKAIIFTATKIYADKLAAHLQDQGFSAAAIHGDLRQNVRNRTLDQFRAGKIQFLIATDVAARGIDVTDVTHVINYDLPRFCEDYVHRIGRTGRAGKTGIAISFVLPSDSKHLQRIERYTNQRIKLMNADLSQAAHDDENNFVVMKKKARFPQRDKQPAAGKERERYKKRSDEYPTSFKNKHEDKYKKRRTTDSSSEKPFKFRKEGASKSETSRGEKPFRFRKEGASKSETSRGEKPFRFRKDGASKSETSRGEKPFRFRKEDPSKSDAIPFNPRRPKDRNKKTAFEYEERPRFQKRSKSKDSEDNSFRPLSPKKPNDRNKKAAFVHEERPQFQKRPKFKDNQDGSFRPFKKKHREG